MITIPVFMAKPPEWYTTKMPDDKLESLTASDWDQLTNELNTYNKAVREFNAAIRKAGDQFVGLAKQVYGTHHKVVDYLQRNPPSETKGEIGLHNLTNRYDILRKAAQQREKEQAEKNLLVQAAVFLTQHGKVVGVDYNSEAAIVAANELRFWELVAEKLASDSLFDFSGQNCDECSGWDGESRRCECGNRRVSWTYEGNFTNMYIYGEAY